MYGAYCLETQSCIACTDHAPCVLTCLPRALSWQEGAADGDQATAEQQAAAAVADLEQQLKQLREDAARTQEMLSQDVSGAPARYLAS